MNSQHTIICLGGGIEALPILLKVKAMGHRIVVVDGNPHAPGREWGIPLKASCYHAPETVAALVSLCVPYDAVLCSAIDAPLVAAEVSSAFGLPGLSVDSARLGADKWLQKHELQDFVPVPMFWQIGTLDQVRGFARQGNRIVKPLDSRGGRGVIRLLPGVDPRWAYEQACAQSPTGRVMVEEWLDGPQLSTESIIQDGRVLFTAVGLRNYARLDEFAPFCIEDGFDEPFYSHVELDIEISNVIEDASRALGWDNCVIKGDLVIHNGKIYVIELAPRLSGGLFCVAHNTCYQFDFISAAVKLALGERVEDRPRTHWREYVSQRYVFPRPSDIGRRIASLPPVNKLVFSAHWAKSPGYVIEPVTSHAARLGQAMAVGDTPEQARERAERAVREMYSGMVTE